MRNKFEFYDKNHNLLLEREVMYTDFELWENTKQRLKAGMWPRNSKYVVLIQSRDKQCYYAPRIYGALYSRLTSMDDVKYSLKNYGLN